MNECLGSLIFFFLGYLFAALLLFLSKRKSERETARQAKRQQRRQHEYQESLRAYQLDVDDNSSEDVTQWMG